jgi:hydroxypyruvate isomerase
MNRREFSQLAAGTAVVQSFLRGNAQQVQPADRIRFSVMLWTLEERAPFERCIEIVAAAGYQGVELVGEFQKWSVADTQRVMTKMRSLGLVFDAMTGVKAGFANQAESTDFITQFAAQIKWAKELECPQIILLSGKRVAGVTREDQRRTAIENLKRASDLAAKNGVEIVIEPIDPLENPTIYLTTVSEGFEIVQAVNSKHVKVLYDFYHEQRSFGNLIEKLETHIEWIGLVHVADVPGRHEPGTGEINYENIYRKLAELNYRGYTAMEFYPTGDPEAALRKERIAALQAVRRFGSSQVRREKESN